MRIFRVLLCALFGHKIEKMPWWTSHFMPALLQVGHRDFDTLYTGCVCSRCGVLFIIKEKANVKDAQAKAAKANAGKDARVGRDAR
jgi:hypothetical protein